MKIFENLFTKKTEDNSIYDEWQKNLNYLQTIKPNTTVVTHIMLKEKTEQYILLYQENNVLFMSKSIDSEIQIIFAPIHESMKNNAKVWECIKSSKERGFIVPNESLMQFLVEKMENNAGFCGFKMDDELQFWRMICLFTQNMKTPSFDIPTYQENQNEWVD